MKILILGGNRFFGKKLAAQLLGDGHDVTLLNRSGSSADLGTKSIKADRTNEAQLRSAVGDSEWDIVFDQVCYKAQEAALAASVFKERTGHYVFTSTQSVYGRGANLLEDIVVPLEHRFTEDSAKEPDYGEAKRQCENVFAKKMGSLVSMIRFPVVMGTDDYTNRLKFHVEHVQSGAPFVLPNPDARISFINSDDAAAALAFIGMKGPLGPVNVASPLPIALHEVMKTVETAVGRKAIYTDVESETNQSPYGIDKHWWMNVDKLRSLGFEANPIQNWLPGVCESLTTKS